MANSADIKEGLGPATTNQSNPLTWGSVKEVFSLVADSFNNLGQTAMGADIISIVNGNGTELGAFYDGIAPVLKDCITAFTNLGSTSIATEIKTFIAQMPGSDPIYIDQVHALIIDIATALAALGQ